VSGAAARACTAPEPAGPPGGTGPDGDGAACSRRACLDAAWTAVSSKLAQIADGSVRTAYNNDSYTSTRAAPRHPYGSRTARCRGRGAASSGDDDGRALHCSCARARLALRIRARALTNDRTDASEECAVIRYLALALS